MNKITSVTENNELLDSSFVMPATEEGKLIIKLQLALKDMLEFIEEMPDYIHPVLKKEIRKTAIYDHAVKALELGKAYERKFFFKSSSLNNADEMSLPTKLPP